MKVSVARRNAALDNLCAALNSGYLRIYDGSKPAGPDTAIGAQVLLAELTFGATAFAAASGGSATANAITQDVSANAAGTATWARLFASNGTTAIADITVGTSGAELNLGSVTFSIGLIVQVSSCVLTQADGT